MVNVAINNHHHKYYFRISIIIFTVDVKYLNVELIQLLAGLLHVIFMLGNKLCCVCTHSLDLSLQLLDLNENNHYIFTNIARVTHKKDHYSDDKYNH